MEESYEDDGMSMSVVNVGEIAFMLIVEEDGTVEVTGKAKGRYVVDTLRSIADSIEQEGFNDD